MRHVKPATMAELDLGSLSLEASKTGLRSALRSKAYLAPSGEDDLDQLQMQLTTYKLSDDAKDLPYIVQGDPLSLRLNFCVDLDHVVREEVFASLPWRLRSAKVAWPENVLAALY
jgi:hypothetical protein